MSLLLAKFVKNSHIYIRISLIFLKKLPERASNSFNTEFQSQSKD